MNMIYEESVPVAISPQYWIIGAVHIKNGCCKDRPVIITVNKSPLGGLNYSCQCACGGWCTTGHASASKALEEYEVMSMKG